MIFNSGNVHCLACSLSHFTRHQGYFDNKTAFEWWIATSKLIKKTVFLTNEVLIFSFVDFQCDIITSDGAIHSRSLPFKLNLKVSSPWDQILRTLLWHECLTWDVNQEELWKFNEMCVRKFYLRKLFDKSDKKQLRGDECF